MPANQFIDADVSERDLFHKRHTIIQVIFNKIEFRTILRNHFPGK